MRWWLVIFIFILLMTDIFAQTPKAAPTPSPVPTPTTKERMLKICKQEMASLCPGVSEVGGHLRRCLIDYGKDMRGPCREFLDEKKTKAKVRREQKKIECAKYPSKKCPGKREKKVKS